MTVELLAFAALRVRPEYDYLFFLHLFLFILSFPQLTLIGYNDKLRVLLEAVVEKIVKFEVKEDRFSVIKVSISNILLHIHISTL